MNIHQRLTKKSGLPCGSLATLAAALALSACGGGTAPSSPGAVTAVTATSVETGAVTTPFIPVTGVNGTAPYTYSVSPALPAGLSLDGTTGAVSGTPTAAQATVIYAVTVADTNALTATSDFTLTITPGVTAAAAVAATTAVAYSASTPFTPVTAANGTAPYAFSVTPALPAGLSFNAKTGAVSGTPTVVAAQAAYTVSIVDAVSSKASGIFNLTVNAPPYTPLSVTTSVASSSLGSGPAITPFVPVTATGGFGTLVYAISPALPTGLAMNSATGTISGASTVISASTTYTVTVTDQFATNLSATFTLAVNPGPLAASATVPAVSVGTSAALTPVVPVTAAGGVPPYTYAIAPAMITIGTVTNTMAAPALSKTGLSFDPSTGTLSGTAVALLGSAPYMVTVTDSATTTSSTTFELTNLPSGYVLSGGLTWMVPPNATNQPAGTVGVNGTFLHADALVICAGTVNGTTGWRLPTNAELIALYAATKNASGTGNSYLASLGWSTSSAFYWASDAGTSSGTFDRVSIGAGSTSSQGKTSYNDVTCVQ